MSTRKPTFEGYGTPIVLIFDHQNNPVLDLRVGGGGSYDIALESFNFEFKEKEEDKCTIQMSSSLLPIMDDVNFFYGQRLKLAWGYLNGDINPPIEMIIVNTKEEFTTKGFALTLELSDTLSVVSNAVNPQITVLQAKLDTFKFFHKSLNQDVQVDNITPLIFNKKVEDWAKAKAKVDDALKGTVKDPEARAKMVDDIIDEEIKARTINADQRKTWTGVDDNQAEAVTEEAKKQLSRHINYQRFTPGVINALLEVAGPDPNFNWARTLGAEEFLALKPEYGNHLYVTGHNTLKIMTNTANQVSVTPKQVTGRDGKAITYDKRRAYATPPIDTYTWKAEDGRFLEFTYDSNSKYSNDNSVLSQFTINAETGAITRRDYIKEVEIEVDVTKNPQKYMQSIADANLSDKLNKIIAEGGNQETYLLSMPGSHMTQMPDGRLAGYVYSGIMGQEFPYNFGYKGEKKNMGFTPNMNIRKGDMEKPIVQDYIQPMDGIGSAMPGLPIVVVPTMECAEDEESLQNEMKSLKQADGEQVKATAKVLGDPQLYSGVNVTLLGLGRRRSGKYFLTGVIHNIQPGSGFILTLEGYLVSTQATGIGVTKSTVTKEEIKTKAKDIKKSKIKVSPNSAEIEARGYYLPTDFYQTEMEAEMFKKDKEWANKMPGVIYEVTGTDPKTKQKRTVKVKCPIDPITGQQQYPYQVFGNNMFWDLIGQDGDLRGNTITKTNKDGSTTVAEFTEWKTIR